MNTTTDGYISNDGKWAAVPYGNQKYIVIYNGEQLSTHRELRTAKEFILKQTRKRK